MLTPQDLLEMVKLGIIPLSSAVSFLAWRIHLAKKKKDLEDKGFSKRKWKNFNEKER